ncbi:hypothetical protein [Stagnihabitans tardus]|uniref:Uncharacterized protein n=1 Tax=Stagnihabitans tardus TaxID=2699202 RepID=A0AAE5BUQ1_9RHOB|nr:hypothetical protein [Stagnihabitans tardus]NBZ87457.1 hypothetical protein [Stagnihabitans tardus]
MMGCIQGHRFLQIAAPVLGRDPVGGKRKIFGENYLLGRGDWAARSMKSPRSLQKKTKYNGLWQTGKGDFQMGAAMLMGLGLALAFKGGRLWLVLGGTVAILGLALMALDFMVGAVSAGLI